MSWYATPYMLLLLIPPVISAPLPQWHGGGAPRLERGRWCGWAERGCLGLAYLLELHSDGLPAKLFWNNLEYVGIAIVPRRAAFALEYTGRGGWLTRRNMALLAVMPLLTVAVVWTTSSHSLYYSDPAWPGPARSSRCR